MAKRKRMRFYVIPAKRADGGWDIKRGKRRIAWSPLKAGAVAYAREQAKAARARGRLTQLVVYGTDGRIQYEHTYGQDPRRYRG